MSRSRKLKNSSLMLAVAAAAGAVGIASGSVWTHDLSARPVECEFNVCFYSSGNCDQSDIYKNCREKTEFPGCESYNCPS